MRTMDMCFITVSLGKYSPQYSVCTLCTGSELNASHIGWLTQVNYGGYIMTAELGMTDGVVFIYLQREST